MVIKKGFLPLVGMTGGNGVSEGGAAALAHTSSPL